ncbi:IS110 family transposase [Patescibacteria group bacterium]|nr:IS110 family transposase [Patescibacteria group bacterium]
MEFAAFVGWDWADQKHDLCLIDVASGKKERSVIKSTPEAIDEWATSMRKRFSGRPVAVCLEQSRGPLIFALLKYDFLILYPVNPTTLAKYREAFSPSRAKDDPTDAEYAAELVMQHRDRLKAWRPDDEKTRTLQYLVEHRRRIVSDRTRVSNRMTALLKLYFPQVLDWFDDVRTDLVCDFLLQWPTLEEVKRVRRPTLEKFFRSHHSVSTKTNEQRFASIKEAVPLTNDVAVIAASVVMSKVLANQMKVTIAAIREFDKRIEELCAAHDDFHLFASLPGSGTVYSSRLLAAFGTDREKYESADEMSCLAGIAPVMERSGASCWVRWRYFCPKFLRQSFVEYAGESTKHSFWARAYYEQQRAKGKSRQAAVRALAFKWIRIIYRCWQTRTEYNEVKYLESLRKKGSSLLGFAASHAA